MLDLHKCARFFACCANKSFFIIAFSFSSLSAFEYQNGLETGPRPCEHEWVMRYFNSLSDSTSIEEVVDFLVSLRAALYAKGYQVPSLADLCLKMRDSLIEKEVEINEDEIEEIYNEILKREVSLTNPSSFSHAVNKFSKFKIIEVKKNKKKDIKLKMSDRFAMGFVKALGGALLCVIPHPVTWGIGGALVADGIKDMIAYAGDSPSEGNVEDRLKNLPPPPQYSNP